MAQFEKHFTVAEANALLPELRELLGELRRLQQFIRIEWEKSTPVIRAAHTNGGGKPVGPFVKGLFELNSEVRRLIGLGVELKDLEKGLIDFPAWRGEEEVFLCWHEGETAVGFWHDLKSGFAGRRPL
jgi:hypothetical protein